MSNADKPFSSPASPTDKLQTLLQDQALRNAERRKQASTFSQFASAEAAQDAGRFAAINKATVTGSASMPEYPRQPEGSFSNQTVPPEEPIDATDCGATFGVALGEPHEQSFEHAAQTSPSLDADPRVEAERSVVSSPRAPAQPIPTNKRSR